MVLEKPTIQTYVKMELPHWECIRRNDKRTRKIGSQRTAVINDI